MSEYCKAKWEYLLSRYCFLALHGSVPVPLLDTCDIMIVIAKALYLHTWFQYPILTKCEW